MFTGIVERCGTVRSVEPRAGRVRLTVAVPGWRRLPVGASVAVNGVCLTVVAAEAGAFQVEAVPETLGRTNLGALRPGDAVNLERAARLGARLDGHLVTGHVDATGEVEELAPDPADPDVRWLRVRAPAGVMRYVVPKGSIAVDGISLTVAACDPAGFSVTVVPHTWEVTNLRFRRPGDRVNLEADLIGKYVERLLAARADLRGAGAAGGGT